MQEIVAELDYEEVLEGWLIRPVFFVPRDEPDSRPSVTIQLFHTLCREHTPAYCSLTNRDEFLAGSMPEYECNICGDPSPIFVIEKKILAAHHYKGYDPRNDRRAAVLATKMSKNEGK